MECLLYCQNTVSHNTVEEPLDFMQIDSICFKGALTEEKTNMRI